MWVRLCLGYQAFLGAFRGNQKQHNILWFLCLGGRGGKPKGATPHSYTYIYIYTLYIYRYVYIYKHIYIHIYIYIILGEGGSSLKKDEPFCQQPGPVPSPPARRTRCRCAPRTSALKRTFHRMGAFKGTQQQGSLHENT